VVAATRGAVTEFMALTWQRLLNDRTTTGKTAARSAHGSWPRCWQRLALAAIVVF
jgi:hypothetical protein